jgi:prevent-host-death family protein
MLQPVSVTQARNNFADLLGQVYYGGKRVLIQKQGKSLAVLTDAGEYQRFEEVRDYFFNRIKSRRLQNKAIPTSQVEKDVAEAIMAVRGKKDGE